MPTHQFNSDMLPDHLFTPGALKHLVIGNECRLLDKRRTPGIIRSIDMDGGFFRWEISDFEDKGKFWDVEFERVTTYQFKQGSRELSPSEAEQFNLRVVALDQVIEIVATEENTANTQHNLKHRTEAAEKWIKAHSQFLRSHAAIDFQNRTSPSLLRADFNQYMDESSLREMERKTAEIQVINPHSGDWIRAMHVVMAEMGIKNYKGRKTRSSQAFEGTGSKEKRKAYIEHRLGFLRAMFSCLGIKEVELYRGMSTEWNWRPDIANQFRFWSSWTFNYQVAQDFTELKPGTKHRNAYLIKRAMPVEQLFMTYLETDAMNQQYLEAEALVLHSHDDRRLW